MAESSVSKSDAEMEEMLDRMLTRLALCEDSKLQSLLSKLLPVSISSLSSKSINVRNKVLEILSHVNKRVKYQPDISLPLTELWNLYLEANSAPMVRNFCIVYIEMAFDRIHGKEKENMAPILVANISKLPSLHQEIILRIVIKVIGQSYSSQVADEVSTKYKLVNSSQELELFVEFCLHTVLYQLQFQSGGCPPGLSIAQTKRVTGKEALNSDTLLLRKLGILNVIDAMDLPSEVVYPIYVAACVDSQEAVVKRGEELLKKKASGANLDDQRLINKLFTLFNGYRVQGSGAKSVVFALPVLNLVRCMFCQICLGIPLQLSSRGCTENLYDDRIMLGEKLMDHEALTCQNHSTIRTENAAPESKINPGTPALKGKLMSIFCRSITAANSFPSTLQCIFDCIYGSGTTSKLKQMGMEFTVWVFKHAKSDQLMLMGPVILNGILKSLESDSNSASDAIARDAKTFAFQSIGLLAQRMPQLFRDKIDMAVRLFEALKVEGQLLRPIIQDSTNSLASAYKGAPETVLKDLEKILLLNSLEEQNEVRFCAVRWATSVFDLEHCPSRYICMLAASDSKLDIRDMALEGLFPLKDEGQNISQNLTLRYPKFEVMLTYILQQHPKLLDSAEMRETKLIFSSKTYVAIIKFLLICFEIELEQNNSVKVALNFQSSAEAMSSLLEHAMAFEGSAELHVCALKALITIGYYFPEMIASRYSKKILLLKQLLGHVDWDARESAALLLGIASSALPSLGSSALVEELLVSISGIDKLRFETQHGTICAIGYVTADCASKEPLISLTLYETVLKCLVDIVNCETATLASVAMQALGYIGLRAPLPPVNNNACSADILSILRETLNKLLLGDETKAIQRILISIGHIGFKESTPSCLNVALDLIFSLCRSKVEDILFAAGEALSFLWGAVPVTADVILKTNYTSLSMTSNFLMRDLNPSLFQYNHGETVETSEDFHAVVRDSITRKLFDVLLYSTRKEERCAGTVWLLSLTMYCGNHPTIQQMLPDIQEAFSHLLGEQNELTQELASQGMSIVYELGDASMKQNLVNALVSTLTGSGKKKRAIKLVEDSEVFQEGSIGESISGGKLSTYKELCSLANEMGKPDLIYKFMDLANHQASLNSKRGAAFGFSKVAKQAGDALKPHLHSLIPRLLRYQYDPDKNVQDAMTHIWKSLVADSKKTIDENYDLIMNDLLIQCGSRLWRSREASCLALSDIVQGRRFSQVGKYLRKIWSAAFRAMDDIKETVRISGEKLCRVLTSLTIRLCDVSLTEVADAREAMELVLPFLLAEGILSKVENIRKASIGIVMKLAKGAGVAIRPHMSDLVCCMLEGLSSLEDQGLNYVELHAGNAGIQKEKLENLRISIAKSSPMWETLDLCINVVDGESLNSLVPRVAQLVRSGVGLNTRVGVANFITLLVRKVGEEIKPYTNMLLRLLFPVVKEEKSASAKRAFSGACAIVLKYAVHSQVQKLIEESTALHASDKNAQISCAILLKNYSSVASDIMIGYQSLIIPVIFISRFEDDKFVSDLYEELWEETTSGERITIQLYLGEIVSLICESIGSTSWASKRKSAFAISKVCEVLGESISSYHHVILQSLMKEIPGRLWEGKEALLHALGALSTSCHKLIHSADPATPKAILSLVSSATTKQDKTFREAALSCLEQVVKAFSSPEFFKIIFPSLFDMCNRFALNKSGQAPVASEAVKSGSDGVENSSISQVKILNCLASSVHDAHMNDILDRQNDLVHVITSLSLGFPWNVKTSTFSLIRELCSRFHEILLNCDGTLSPDHITNFVLELIHRGSPLVIQCISTIKIAQVHVSASECLLEITQLCIHMPSVNWTDVGFHAELLHQYEVEKNEVAKSLLRKSIENLENPKQHNAQDSSKQLSS